MSKKKRLALEFVNTNLPFPYEDIEGDDNQPVTLPDSNEEERFFPSLNPHHYNDNLISSIRSSRENRLALQLVKRRQQKTSRLR